ncbi:MAG: PilZ domain-containing protein [Candidatus Abyssobacteria bacterium SURF_5]|uniref:PilZ domain-containing protein n=1 Tax=Abyssobacteria bacterium (strain SURF_5) TaxID=2093360 RepID=A0A3A4MXP0_ABYX5|nr:MAG: PilZ domain-containing protein [Candidatus Abyssubacteria bacterium SURF_5]
MSGGRYPITIREREDPMATEKRRSARRRYKEEIDFEAMIPGSKMPRVTPHHAHCRDISQGGLGIIIGFQPREGEIVKLSIPFKKGITLPVFAEVIWTTAEADDFRAGMRFLS